ncbi:MAG: hypothetical protein WBW14_10775, partial [Candidatus Acidiferrum sp.]
DQPNLGAFQVPLCLRMRRRRRFSPYTHWNRATSRKSHPKVLSARKIVSGDMTVTLPPTKE